MDAASAHGCVCIASLTQNEMLLPSVRHIAEFVTPGLHPDRCHLLEASCEIKVLYTTRRRPTPLVPGVYRRRRVCFGKALRVTQTECQTQTRPLQH